MAWILNQDIVLSLMRFESNRHKQLDKSLFIENSDGLGDVFYLRCAPPNRRSHFGEGSTTALRMVPSALNLGFGSYSHRPFRTKIRHRRLIYLMPELYL